MDYLLPEEYWYENTAARCFMLCPEKVAAEIKRLRSALQELVDDPYIDSEGTRQHFLRALGQ